MVRSWTGRPTAGALVAIWLPVACFAVLAWQHRWVSDDGYINLRIVWNVLHGDGPVFNAGERVEAGTSPLWIAVLVVARIPLWFLDPGWVAVLVGIAATLVGIACAAVGARRWWSSLGRSAPLPLGAALIVALPPMWDFASSGLETGLSFAWIGACWWATARRLEVGIEAEANGDAGATATHGGGWYGNDSGRYGTGDDAAPTPGRDDGQPHTGDREPWRPSLDRPRWVPVLIGLGPLVRPDFALFSVAFAVAHVATSSRSTRSTAGKALGLGLALPIAYQVFRMGYYGLLVPNTALAKEAGRDLWDRGWNYLDIYLGSTLVLLPLLLLLLVFALEAPSSGATRRHAIVAAAPIVAGIVHALYVVRVGGDFMYARLFLPATFALVCPFSAFPLPRPRPLLWGPIGALSCTLVLTGGFRRWDPVRISDDPATPQLDGDLSIDGVANERLVYRLLAGKDHPITYDDYATYIETPLANLGELPRAGTLVDLGGSGRFATSKRPMLVAGSIGLVGYRYLGTHVIDQLSLADPLGAHMAPGQATRPGHEKILPWEWLVARFAEPSADEPTIEDARAALGCGKLEDLVAAVEDPLTPGRFVDNLFGSIGRTRLRVPPLPAEARVAFC